MQELLMILKRKAKLKPSYEFQAKVAILPSFNRKANKVREFVTVYKLYLRIRMEEIIVEEQVQ